MKITKQLALVALLLLTKTSTTSCEFTEEQKAEIRSLIREEVEKLYVRIDVSLMDRLNETREVMEKLKATVEPQQKKLESLTTDFTKKQQEYQRMESTLSETAKRKKQEELYKISVEIQNLERAIQEYVMNVQQEMQIKILQKIKDVSDALRKEKGYLNISLSSPMSGTIAGTEMSDISTAVIERLNKLYEEEKKKTEKPVVKGMVDKNK